MILNYSGIPLFQPPEMRKLLYQGYLICLNSSLQTSLLKMRPYLLFKGVWNRAVPLYHKAFFLQQEQQQESGIPTTPLEKMGLTEGSNIHKRSVISNGGDKEEGKDVIAESCEKHEGEFYCV